METENIVVDTDVIINYVRKKPQSLAKYFYEQAQGKIRLFVSSITIFEYYSGSDLLDSELLQGAEILFQRFTFQEVNSDIAKIGAQINREKKLYQRIQAADLLIGATCLYLSGRLLTKNKRHFKFIPGLKFVA